MYTAPPPLGAASARASNRQLTPRVYKLWKGNNIFFLRGRIIFGPDVRSLFLTVFLIVTPVLIFCALVARKLMDDFNKHLGVCIMVFVVFITLVDLTLLIFTCGRDPGIVPRNTHPPEPEGDEGLSGVGTGQNPQFRLPRTKDVQVNGMTVKIKYCDTCMLYRPPRCSHCSICNNCVENFDHHCPWVGQCIGLRNYRFFFMFIISTTLLCVYVFGFCWVYIVKIKNSEDITIWRAMIKTPASIVLIIYTALPFIFVAGLSLFHTYLISTNQTTYENFRYQYDRRANPYNRGICANFKEKFFTCVPPSRNNFRARVQLPQALPDGAVDGGFISPNMGRAGEELEIGRKATWSEVGSGLNMEDLENGLGNGRLETKEGGSSDADRD